MADEFEFGDVEELLGIVNKLQGNLRSKDALVRQLKQAARLLEQLPQEVGLLGGAKAGLEAALVDRHVLGSKHKDVRMYLAVCMAHMLRIYAPDTPWEDKELEPVFDLLLWSVQQVQESQAPTFELAVSVLQTISETKSYFLLLDLQREDIVLDWVRALLQCINSGSFALAGRHAMEVLTGLVGSEEGHTDDVLEVLLSHLVPPKSVESPAACQLSQAVLKACEANIKPQLQKFLTKLIQCPISSNSDLHRQCYTLIYQVYQAVPQVLLPVLPHLTSELQAEEGPKRLEAVCLMGKLFGLPGNRLVCEYADMLDALLERYQDTQVGVRVKMLEFTPSLVAAAGDEAQQKKVLQTAANRLQDYDEKVRVAAVKLVCQTVRQLLVGPAHAAAGAACKQHVLALSLPTADLLGGLASQEDDALAAEELGVAFTPPEAADGRAGKAQAAVRDLACLADVMQRVTYRLKDTKLAVRKAAASGMMSVFRAVAAAGDSQQVAQCSSLPARVLVGCRADVELRQHVVEVVMRDGLLSSQLAPAQAAAVFVRVWLTALEPQRQALIMLINLRTKLQGAALQFVALRRQLSGRDGDGDGPDPDVTRAELGRAAREVAKLLPDPHKAAEGLAALQAVRDNHVFASLQQALAPAATAEAYGKYRADVLSRVGSKSAAAELVGQLLLWARPAAWLPQPLLAALLELAAGDPGGEQGELVVGAFQLLQEVSKHAGALFAGLLPQLHGLVCSAEPELQQLGVQLLAQCAIQLRKRGVVLSASPDAATSALVVQQLLPRLRLLARGAAAGAAPAPPGSPGGEASAELSELEVSGGEGGCTPKAAKWAVYALVCCQDGAAGRQELNSLADELAGGLDAAAPETAAKLQALSAVGRLYPEAFGRHVDQLLHFVLDDYLLSYLDAAATGAGGGGASTPRSPGGGRSQQPSCSPGGGGAGGSQECDLAVGLKGAALRALAAGCVPDSDGGEVPVETLRAVARLAETLEGLLDPSDEGRPAFLANETPEAAGQLRAAAASALLRLARRHDSRLAPGCYCQLGLVMQDSLEGVRREFAAKVARLMAFFQQRPSTHQLAAKYAAMLPLAGMDPSPTNKAAAARLLRDWVHRRRMHVQQLITAAAAAGGAGTSAQGGGSTLQDLPEMVLPYCMYILAHHPDFPQGEDAGEAEFFGPFQLMLQFMLAPLLAASGGSPAAATAPALLKICRTLKRTADNGAEPANTPLYVLCDMAAAVLAALAGELGLQLPGLPEYPGTVVLPRGLYKPLDKAQRVGSMASYLPPGFEVALDPGALAALAQPTAAAAAATARSKQPERAVAAGRGKRKSPAARKDKDTAAAAAADGGKPPPRKTARGGGQAGGRGGSKKAAAAASDSESEGGGGGSDSDSEGAPPAAGRAEQQLTRRQQQLQQQKQRKQQQQQAEHSSPGADGDAAVDPPVKQRDRRQQQQHQQQEEEPTEGDGNSQATPAKQQRKRQAAKAPPSAEPEGRQKIVLKQVLQPLQQNGKQQQVNGKQQVKGKQQGGKQQQLSFRAAPGDASSPAPAAKRHRGAAAADHAAGEQQAAATAADSWDYEDDAQGEQAAAPSSGGAAAAAADSPASRQQPAGRAQRKQQGQPPAGRASKRAQAPAAAEDDGEEEQQVHGPAAAKASKSAAAAAADVPQPAGRGRPAGKKATAAAAAVSDASMQEDQEERRRAKAAAAPAAAASKKRLAAASKPAAARAARPRRVA